MTEVNKQRMWDIDQALQVGETVSTQDVEFFNAHFELMKEEMQSNNNHWQYNVSKI